MQVLVRDNNVDQALRALKKKMQREGIFREMKLRGHYEKPSEKKARERAEAVRRARKLIRKRMQREGLLPSKPRPPGAALGPKASAFPNLQVGARPQRAALISFDGLLRLTELSVSTPSEILSVLPLPLKRLKPLGLLLADRSRLAALRHGEPVGPCGIAVVEDDSQGTSNVNISSLTEVIQRNPSDPSAYNTRGAAYARVGRYGDAISDFNQALQLDPNYAPAYANRALAFRQTNRNDQALADFSRAIQADPNYGPAYIGRGNLLQSPGSLPGGAERPDGRDPPDARIGRGASCARAALPAPGRPPAGDPRLRRCHRPQPVRRRAIRRPRPEPCRHKPVRQGDRGFQRRAQREQQGRRILGLARHRLRAAGPPPGGGRELPARARRRPATHGEAGPRPRPGRRVLPGLSALPPSLARACPGHPRLWCCSARPRRGSSGSCLARG